MIKLDQGYIHVYTGNGKGKTTAAIGLAVRAAGANLRTCIIQFMKDHPYNELTSLKQLSKWITIEQFGNDSFVFRKAKPSGELINIINNGIEKTEENMLSGNYDLIILDEICVSIYFSLVTTERVIELINKKPKNVELILTGRYCPTEIINIADLVTEMKEGKHYYQKGIEARNGIES